MDNSTKKFPRTLSGADAAFKDANYASAVHHVVASAWELDLFFWGLVCALGFVCLMLVAL